MIPATLRRMELTNLRALSATDAARLIREGAIASEQYVAACLARVRETDARIGAWAFLDPDHALRSEEHTSELQSHSDLVCRLLLEKKKNKKKQIRHSE